MADVAELLSTLAELDKTAPAKAQTVDTFEPTDTGDDIETNAPVFGETSVDQVTYTPKTQFGRFVDTRHKERIAREASMTDAEKEMRANRVSQIANIFLKPVAGALMSVASGGRVAPNLDSNEGVARQQALASRMSELEGAREKERYRADISGTDFGSPELNKLAPHLEPSELASMLTRMAGYNRPRTVGVSTEPLSDEEMAVASEYGIEDLQSPVLVRNTIAGIKKALATQRPYDDSQSAYDYLRTEKMRQDVEKGKREIASAPEEGAGRPMQTQQAENLSDFSASSRQLSELIGGLKDVNAPTGPVAYLRGQNPFDVSAQGGKQLIAATKQLVGKALEGGVMRAEDEKKYAKILPRETDTYDVILQKVSTLQSMLQNAYRAKLQSYKAAGFDISGFSNDLRNFTATETERPTISTEAEYNALPVGTKYIWGPNGKPGTKR